MKATVKWPVSEMFIAIWGWHASDVIGWLVHLCEVAEVEEYQAIVRGLCLKCNGAGWDGSADDTRYPCNSCC